METKAQLGMLIDLLERLGVTVRQARLDGSGGGLCVIRGQQVLFVDLDAEVASRVQCCLQALASLPSVDRVYVPPTLREAIDRARNSQQA